MRKEDRCKRERREKGEERRVVGAKGEDGRGRKSGWGEGEEGRGVVGARERREEWLGRGRGWKSGGGKGRR
jgi:hypothetical protein